jgi:DNA-binding NtrC family response regulator
MATRTKSNEAFMATAMWRQASTPRISILKQLAVKLVSEVESLNDKERLDFGAGFKLGDELQRFEIDMIRHALYLTNGHQSYAAKLLGIKKTTLHAKLKRFAMDRKSQLPASKRSD